MIVVSGILWIMDNYSSYIAVISMDVITTRPGTGWFGDALIYASFLAKAFIPQGLATVMFSIFLLMDTPDTGTERFFKIASLVVGILAWIYDGWTGYIFYLNTDVVGTITLWYGIQDPVLYTYFRDALINAVIYDTLGSEFLLSITVGIFGVIAADYIDQMRSLSKSLRGATAGIQWPARPSVSQEQRPQEQRPAGHGQPIGLPQQRPARPQGANLQRPHGR
jgi:hypothetical protein